jgi:transposase
MPGPLSVDLRKRVVDAAKTMKKTDIEKTFGVSRGAIYKWIELEEKTGSLEPKSGYQKGHSPKITDLGQFRSFVEEHKGMTTQKMADEWEELTGVKVSDSCIERNLKKIGYSCKKKLFIMQNQTKKKESSI